MNKLGSAQSPVSPVGAGRERIRVGSLRSSTQFGSIRSEFPPVVEFKALDGLAIRVAVSGRGIEGLKSYTLSIDILIGQIRQERPVDEGVAAASGCSIGSLASI